MQGFFCSHAGMEDAVMRTALYDFGYDGALERLASLPLLDDAQAVEAQEAAEAEAEAEKAEEGLAYAEVKKTKAEVVGFPLDI